MPRSGPSGTVASFRQRTGRGQQGGCTKRWRAKKTVSRKSASAWSRPTAPRAATAWGSSTFSTVSRADGRKRATRSSREFPSSTSVKESREAKESSEESERGSSWPPLSNAPPCAPARRGAKPPNCLLEDEFVRWGVAFCSCSATCRLDSARFSKSLRWLSAKSPMCCISASSSCWISSGSSSTSIRATEDPRLPDQNERRLDAAPMLPKKLERTAETSEVAEPRRMMPRRSGPSPMGISYEGP
mmetsp:Transcript_48241/g.94245  ORF Transcript_48241/g.94245 Transcript_48241/m.94245 type:complete len:244 (-) Transcript_48241:519-1250(-)